jgi:hypothetical protein
MAPRWVSFARVSMQRPGQLIAVAAAASESAPVNLAGLAQRYAQIVRRRHQVEASRSDEVIRYLRALRLWKRYGGQQGALAKLDQPGALPPVERQDLWLADPDLPSATGAVTDEVIDELPQLGASLGIVRPHNFTRSDRGKAIVALYKADLKQLEAGEPEPNLFRLVTSDTDKKQRRGAACLLAHALIEADGDFLSAAWAAHLDDERPGGFTRASFGEQLPAACRRLADRLARSRAPEDRQVVGRLDTLARHIEEKTPSTERTWGGGRPRDQVATLRLEPFVDFGLVTRTSRTDYRYELNDNQRRFFSTLVTSPDIETFLSSQLVSAYLQALGIAPRPVDTDEIWQRVEHAYSSMRSGLGYASAADVVLLAIATLLDEGGDGAFELGDGLSVLRARQREHPNDIRYGVSRTGEPTYIRLTKAARS